MAKAASHKFGQMIGDLLEDAMLEYMKPIAIKHNLYLDFKHSRQARNGKKEVIWIDSLDNKHKLDLVLEKNGDENKYGNPVAFIEIAWRRYKKHSKNKAQEIQGALLPLVRKYSRHSPFYGAILAGEFTNPSIQQLESEGFKVVYFSYETIIQAFKLIGIEVYWSEDTSDDEVLEKIKQYEKLSIERKNIIIDSLIKSNKDQLKNFIIKLGRVRKPI
ncbi:hypothetical protein [Paenibacillus campi]|uniref:hypothetical protein n=1 Tax=Paenibacillus campi TaxID=3106031 RepID=UPI002AFFDABB|nr:hypothetical protein [Paenibacillus sp. SGZ-1014]